MSNSDRTVPQGWMATGTPDRQTATPDWLVVGCADNPGRRAQGNPACRDFDRLPH
ncbi:MULTISPECIES: hypothetical protein [unclassified Mesorhizobium]|uniref:hypothetical protein n=1 Tax=unclassified Mesorhizobium TaxID=325217 RepID=UPI001FDF165D|nr:MULTISPECIES: hypothetical protein [unclassified Mesorhizobium]